MKKFNRIFVPIFILMTLIFSLNNIFVSDIKNIKVSNNNSTQQINTTNNDLLEVSEDIQSLSLSANLSDKTLSYDVMFNNNDFNGSTIKVAYYEMPSSAFPMDSWNKVDFINSESTVKNRHASKTFSYEQLFDYDASNEITGIDGRVRITLLYEDNGEFLNATKFPFQYFLLENNDSPIAIDDSKSILNTNDEKTYAQVDFNFTNTDDVVLNQIKLKSNTNSKIDQTIYLANNENVLLQGDNSISFQLLDKEVYKDLYLEFDFISPDGANYYYDSLVLNNPEFTSANQGGWTTWSIILLIIIILLMLLVIVFIVFVIKQIQKRKKLEKQHDQEYFDVHYEDGIN